VAQNMIPGNVAWARYPISLLAEELSLHLALHDASHFVREDPTFASDLTALLPHDYYDFNWNACTSMLNDDHDALMLYEPELDGIKDPCDKANIMMGVGDLRPQNRFDPFAATQ
jgi:hypothetical protein